MQEEGAAGSAVPMARLTTHVLDTTHGCPGTGIAIDLYRLDGEQRQLLAQAVTNADGRCDAPLLEGEAFRAGIYELHFHAGDYYRRRGSSLAEPAFLDVVVLRVGLSGEGHYHVPLLVSPYGYSTYRGS
ncbi:5-hydroxyisourate hydrolase [Azotobacter beijerinckii]|uniref:5-hydroxyisourate hydrolase n=2 Tax=Azotobacter beijerinckii TaxID=170623 RepID=A0A1H6QVT0_9GAMM|nr:5-hydroxyisourate hydrolase [Azotobacter beijerinckii]SEI46190.1 5-hydroxyisourate hydrolase [Azotobacter beijerinckii]SEP68668.1 5-hydroxyisourate hydrolase [Azotobacter beijerinckii]